MSLSLGFITAIKGLEAWWPTDTRPGICLFFDDSKHATAFQHFIANDSFHRFTCTNAACPAAVQLDSRIQRLIPLEVRAVTPQNEDHFGLYWRVEKAYKTAQQDF